VQFPLFPDADEFRRAVRQQDGICAGGKRQHPPCQIRTVAKASEKTPVRRGDGAVIDELRSVNNPVASAQQPGWFSLRSLAIKMNAVQLDELRGPSGE
jgi:hypothetical protein